MDHVAFRSGLDATACWRLGTLNKFVQLHPAHPAAQVGKNHITGHPVFGGE
jgi:hypothetical protein